MFSSDNETNKGTILHNTALRFLTIETLKYSSCFAVQNHLAHKKYQI